MKCISCEKVCVEVIEKEKKFCSGCGCSYLYHASHDVFNEICLSIGNEICIVDNNKSTERSMIEAIKLAKTFGTVWLPLGIQPSEVDRYLKYFPTNTDIRRSMFMKSDKRIIEVQLQLPLQDRSIDKLQFTIEESSKMRAYNFFDKRRNENCDFARIDHLDRSEGNSCSECLDSMGFGEVCVMLPKNKKLISQVWHPHCFKCIKCKHVLVDYLFCWDIKDDSGPYCLRHFDDKYHPRCVNCDEIIFDEKYLSIFDESYHWDHFRCYICDDMIGERQFVLDSDITKPQRLWKCITCMKETKESNCVICKEVIEVKDSSIPMDGVMVHENCVKCQICCKKLCLTNEASFIKDIHCLYCLSCNTLRNPDSCSCCGDSIDHKKDDTITYGMYSWHKHCLKCIQCSKDLSSDKDFTVIDDPTNISRIAKLTYGQKFTICKECFIDHHVDVCGVCNKKLEKTGIKYKSKLFHITCFKCHNCEEELKPSLFAFKEDDIYCLQCYGTLFCKCCTYCSKPILGHESNEKMINFENRNWHEKCFMCTLCDKSLMDAGFLFDNEKIICVECGK